MESNNIWKEDYLDSLNPENNKESDPITIFGLSFKNEEERRQYFRDELRKKLPELRKIEGFPIGEDDDIINLSDPPYYTACPNPWLNDFIKQWEEEKIILEREGKRKKDFEVKEPYASDVSEGKNNPVYMAHPYHTKVPHPAIMRYILHYTQPSDIILDGFAGTGMTGVAAAACSRSDDEIAHRISAEWNKSNGTKPVWGTRHAITGDLSPYASNISYFYNTPVDVNALKKEVDRIQKEMDEECGWMYTTLEPIEKGVGKDKHIEMVEGRISFVVWSDIFTCQSCGQEYVFWKQAVDHDQKCMLDEFRCPHCGAMQTKKTAKIATETYFDEHLGKTMERVKQVPVIIVGKAGKKKIQRSPSEYDLEVLSRIERENLSDFFPVDALPEGLKTRDPKAKLVYHVHQFYTRRNLIALSKLYAKIEASPLAHALRFMFTAMINRSSNMNRFSPRNFFYGGGGWCLTGLSGTLYVPNLPMEVSVLAQLDTKLSSMESTQETIARLRPNAQYVGSADCLNIADNSIDYIFTDPPFGANINYSELNSLPEPWLRVITNNKTEAIENPAQGKSAQTYRDTMTRCLHEYYRVLKPGRWMTVEFSNTSAAVWNAIQTALQSAGFVISTVAALDKKQGSFNAVTTTTAVKQDLVISCYKPSQELAGTSQLDADSHLWPFVEELIVNLAKPRIVEGKIRRVPERDRRLLYDKVVSYFVTHGLQVPMNARQFQQGLDERYVEVDGMYFTPIQAADYRELSIKSEGLEAMGLIISDEPNGIAWLKHRLEERPQTYQELQPEWMQDIKGIRKGDILPELRTLLEENFIQNEDGTWRIVNENDDVDVEQRKNKIFLKEFKFYLEVCRKPRGKLKDVRVEAVRAGFKQCYTDKNFADIILVGDRIPQNLLTEDEILLQYYDIASSKV